MENDFLKEVRSQQSWLSGTCPRCMSVKCPVCLSTVGEWKRGCCSQNMVRISTCTQTGTSSGPSMGACGLYPGARPRPQNSPGMGSKCERERCRLPVLGREDMSFPHFCFLWPVLKSSCPPLPPDTSLKSHQCLCPCGPPEAQFLLQKKYWYMYLLDSRVHAKHFVSLLNCILECFIDVSRVHMDQWKHDVWWGPEVRFKHIFYTHLGTLLEENTS